MRNIKTKAIRNALIGIFVVITLNLLILSILGFPKMATNIIIKYFPLLVLLIGGFGLQIGLFTYFHSLNAISCSTTAVSGGISAVSMILCCSHYLLNFLPFLGVLIGISALTVLSRYTLYFLLLGICSNIIGISIIYYQHKRRNKKIRFK